MFQFSGFASITGYPVFNGMGCPIRIFTDQWLFAPTHDFSQLITSFFASESPGIRHAPLFTFLVGVFPFLKRRTLKHYYFFCSVLVLLFESYVFQYVNERFDLCGRGGNRDNTFIICTTCVVSNCVNDSLC